RAQSPIRSILMSPLATVLRRVAVGVALLLPVNAAAQSTIEFSVSGTSTIRAWTCTVQGQVALTGTGQAVPGLPNGLQAATLTVPVKAFSCPNEEMTQHLYESMEVERFPTITFRLEKYEV